MSVSRPVLRYHGGKWRLAPWIIGHFPPHKVYVEPFAGAASVLMRKHPSYAEIYNDLDKRIVEVFRVLRDPVTAARLAELLYFTPYARKEFELSYEDADDPIERARRTIVRSYMGYSSDAATRTVKTGLRGTNLQSGRYAADDWSNLTGGQKAGITGFNGCQTNCGSYPSDEWGKRTGKADKTGFAGLHAVTGNYNGREFGRYGAVIEEFTDRLKSVMIECLPALDVINKYDGHQTLFYCDPPYLHGTREKNSAGRAYRHEMTDSDHRALLDALNGIEGMAMVSGYRSELYDCALDGWLCVEKEAVGQAGKKRGSKSTVECLWLSPRVSACLAPRLAI